MSLPHRYLAIIESADRNCCVLSTYVVEKVFVFSLFIWVLLFSSCKTTLPVGAFVPATNEIDYSDLRNWAAHPNKNDVADNVPGQKMLADQSNFEVDVFFVHPTTYTGKKGHNQWNANIHDHQLNTDTDESTIKYQASIFNQVGKIYAPRYRQAHIHSYFAKDKVLTENVFNKAYQDVKAAFQFYVDNFNNGRPFILASHSQGTTHSKRLIKELIDGKDLADQLVAAYIIGIPVSKKEFDNLKPCDTPNETACIISWRTYKKWHYPELVGDAILVTNPLSWTRDDGYMDKSHNKGAVLRNFDKVLDERVDAQISNGVLWANKPKFPWSFLFTTNNYHVADMNFYYYNIQDNAKERVAAFMNKTINK